MMALGMAAALSVGMEETLREALDHSGFIYESVSCTPAGRCVVESKYRTAVLDCSDVSCMVIRVEEKSE